MANPRALEGDGGVPQGMPMPQDNLDIPTNNKQGFSSWLSKLSSKSARRGSIGFSGEPDRMHRFDDDSGDGMSVDAADTNRFEASLGGIGITARNRNDSMTEMQTPGGDGDLIYFNQYRRRLSTDFTNPEDKGGIPLHITKDGMLQISSDTLMSSADMERNSSASILPIINEGKEIAYAEFPRERKISENMDVDGGLHMNFRHQQDGSGGKFDEMALQQRNASTTAGDPDQVGGDSIFLIDLETVKDDQGIKLKPQSKKFSLTTLLKSQMTNNWFFRNDGVEEDDNASDAHDQSVMDRFHGSVTKKRRSSPRDEDEDDTDAKANDEKYVDGSGPNKISFVGKIRKAVEDHPSRLREMNMWQPQST